MCVFCNQRSISGKQKFDPESVRKEIDNALETLPCDTQAEIAYFGGSFTGIDRELMVYLLDIAEEYVQNAIPNRAKIVGIRMSTRPDYISDSIMDTLGRYSVKTVELGLQSMDDRVLKLSGRGHDSKQAEDACRMIKSKGYDLIGQMMIGLPGSSLENEIYTAKKICKLGADGARIYPTVTFYDTELACMADRGEYKMLSIEDAVYRSKEVAKIFIQHGVDIIRIGLCASDNLGDLSKVKGGANHPALGELVMGELCYDRMCELLSEEFDRQKKGLEVIFTVPNGKISQAIGQKGINKRRLTERFGLSRLLIKEDCVSDIILTQIK